MKSNIGFGIVAQNLEILLHLRLLKVLPISCHLSIPPKNITSVFRVIERSEVGNGILGHSWVSWKRFTLLNKTENNGFTFLIHVSQEYNLEI